MIDYNKNKPLITIHVPKAAGSSFRKIMEHWFGNRIYLHYYDEVNGRMPYRIGLREGFCVYGHFNKNRGFGIESYYPQVDQFITMLRNPLELVVSEYFFMRKTGWKWKDKSRIPLVDIHTYLEKVQINMLNHFPFGLNENNFEEILHSSFIHIGIVEDIGCSIKIIAEKLGFKPPQHVQKLNQTERSQRVPYELLKTFKDKHPLEYKVYEFALKNYNKY